MASAVTTKSQSLLKLLIIAAIVVVLNVLAGLQFRRFDLTSEGRYSVTNPTKELLRQLDDVVYLDVFLAGDMPADYRRMQLAIGDLLTEFAAYSPAPIEWTFRDIFGESETKQQAEAYLKTLTEKGIMPRPIAERQLDEVSQQILVPGAILYYKNKEVAINLLPDQKELNEDPVAVVNKGISTLEYRIASAIQQARAVDQKKVVLIQGHGELLPRQMGDLAVSLQQQNYEVTALDLPREVAIPPVTDVAIIAKPRRPFSEADKFKIDQFVMNGGKVLWVIDAMQAELDSLMTGSASFVSLPNELNLDDQLFQYGVRINRDLLLDRQANQIPLFAQGGQVRNYYPWPFFPVLFPGGNHPVIKHMDPVMAEFASTIDTIEVPELTKTILLHSSAQSTAWRAPVMVRLETATNPPLPEQYNQSNLPVAILLEGQFRSVFRNRVPEDFLRVYRDSLGLSYREQSDFNRMVVVADGDMIRNDVGRDGRIAPLGAYRFNPNYLFANKEFFLNVVDYLTDNDGIIAARTKDFKVRPLDRLKVKEDRWRWQATILGLPVLLMLLFAGVYTFIRTKKYEGKV